METSVNLLERLADEPTNDDWRRPIELYQPRLRAWMARVGVKSANKMSFRAGLRPALGRR